MSCVSVPPTIGPAASPATSASSPSGASVPIGADDATAPRNDASSYAAVPTENTGKANWAYISSGTWSLIGVEVAQAVLTLAFVMVFNFFLFRVLPGDPAALLLRGTTAFNLENLEQVRIEVRDSGSGIPEDAREAIFDEFVQLGNPERDRPKPLQHVAGRRAGIGVSFG